MGTRSLTRVFNKDVEIMCLYRQFDGYLSGHGTDLAKFVVSRPFVNGIGSSNEVFNGIGCFAAQMVCRFKQGIAGGFYLHAPGAKDVGEEFVYEVHGGMDESFQPLPVTIKVFVGPELLFAGSAEQFVAFCETEQEA